MRYKLFLFLVAALTAAAGPISISGSVDAVYDPYPDGTGYFYGAYDLRPFGIDWHEDVAELDWGTLQSRLIVTRNSFAAVPIGSEFVVSTLAFLNVDYNGSGATETLNPGLTITTNFTDPSGWMEAYFFPITVESTPESVTLEHWKLVVHLPPDTVWPGGTGTSLYPPETFQVGDWTYTLTVLGWRDYFSGDQIDHLTVGEGGVGAANLIARVDVHSPEPGTISLILIGVALMATRRFVRR